MKLKKEKYKGLKENIKNNKLKKLHMVLTKKMKMLKQKNQFKKMIKVILK